jgi:GT2 family glycosyltransferase
MLAAPMAVVIPAWNCERYLGEAIESVLGQSVPVDKIVVVDDGSTDGTAAVASRYPAVRLIQQDHSGAGAARNHGVSECDEPLLAFLDADDVWLAHKVECQLECFQSPGVDAAFGLVENFLDPEAADGLIDLRFESRALPGYLPSTMVVTRAEFERVGPFATGAPLTDWVDWYLRLREGGARITAIDRIVTRRRVHGENTTLREAGELRTYVRLVKASMDRRRSVDRQPAMER